MVIVVQLLIRNRHPAADWEKVLIKCAARDAGPLAVTFLDWPLLKNVNAHKYGTPEVLNFRCIAQVS